ncbi:Pyrimidine nucleotide transporter, mitochondrial [Dimargaris xerosporica]|nr:Pyrimidine nucleotide transporter, mitochondrial [Dimargaris xerosporica]
MSSTRAHSVMHNTAPPTTPTPQMAKVDTSINWAHFFGGGIGGTVGAILTCPLEVVKTRLQSSSYQNLHPTTTSPHSTNVMARALRPVWSTFSIVRNIYVYEGIPGLFKGIGPNLVGVIPSRAISFATYGNAKRIYTELNGNQENSLVYLSAAATAGIVTATLTNPIWLVKTRMQLQSHRTSETPRYRNSFHCLYRVVQEEGIRGIYKGLTASYLGVTESTIQWVIYEQLKLIIRERKAKQLGLSTTDAKKMTKDWVDYFGAAGSAKLLAAVITYPHEVLRTRLRQVPTAGMQVRYQGLVHCFATIIKEEGIRALYGGLTAHLLRTVPNAAVMFFCYEFIVQQFGQED